MDNSIQTHEIIQSFFRFLTQRDLEHLTNLFSDKVDWYLPGDEQNAPWLGKRNSREDVKHFYELLWENTEPISANIDNIFVDNEKAAITGEFSTRMLKPNKVVDSLFCIQITISNGLIISYRLLEDSYAVSVSLTPPTELEK